MTHQTENVTPPGTPEPPHWMERIVYGPQGLRAGWGLLLFLILIWFGYTVFGELLYYLPRAQAGDGQHLIPLSHVLFSVPGLFLIVFAVSWLMAHLEGRSLAHYGLDAPVPRLPQFFSGLFWGVAMLSLLVSILWKLHYLSFDRRILGGTDIVRYAVLWLIGFLFVGLLEDFLMRGYIQFTLSRSFTAIYNLFLHRCEPTTIANLGFWTAALFMSCLFGLSHGSNRGESALGLLAAGVAGLVFCLSLWRTGSLWWAIGFHCSWDWAQSFLYGVPDSGGLSAGRLFDTAPLGPTWLSGGATGPEGSVFVFPVLALVAVVIVLTLPKQTSLSVQTEVRENP